MFIFLVICTQNPVVMHRKIERETPYSSRQPRIIFLLQVSLVAETIINNKKSLSIIAICYLSSYITKFRMHHTGKAQHHPTRTQSQEDEDEDDPHVAALGPCIDIYRALELCLGENDRDWTKCQRQVQELRKCSSSSSSGSKQTVVAQPPLADPPTQPKQAK